MAVSTGNGSRCGRVMQHVRRHVHVYLIAGFIVFGIGLILMPGWWKLGWVAVCLALMLFLPTILAKVLDPLNAKRIRAYCAEAAAMTCRLHVATEAREVHSR